MISEKDANEVLMKSGYMKLKVSKFDTWIEQNLKQEGFELVQGKIKSFWIKEGQRIYGEPCSDPVTKVYQTLMSLGENKEGKTKESSLPETKMEKKEDTKKETEKSVAIMPENIEYPVYQKWQKMSVSERLLMLQRTDKQYIKTRPGRAGAQYNYVEGGYMVMAANMAFGFSWISQVTGWEKTPEEIICFGFIEVEIEGKPIRKFAVGQKDIAFVRGSNPQKPVCLGDDYKAAEMDMIKKALSFFGIARDVYSGEV